MNIKFPVKIKHYKYKVFIFICEGHSVLHFRLRLISLVLTHRDLDKIQMGCFGNEICMNVMMVINLRHLHGSSTKVQSLPRCNLLNNELFCSSGNMMTAGWQTKQ